MQISTVAKKISLLYSTSSETPTSFELGREFVNRLPLDWASPNLKILDLSCGRGNIPLAFVERLLKYHKPEQIVNMIYACDISFVQVAITRKALKLALGIEPNVYCDDSLKRNWKMKFDAVVGNPPYADSKREDEANKLWPFFVNKAYELVKDDGYVAMVTPNSWMVPTADIGKGNGKNSVSIFNDIFKKNNLIVANIDSETINKKYFNGVGSTFSYYVMQKSPYNGVTKFITQTGDINIDISKTDSLPKIVNHESMSIMQKMVGEPFKFYDQNHNMNGKESSTNTPEFKHKIYHTNKAGGTYWWGEKLAPYNSSPKVIISISGKYLPVFNDTDGFSNMCLAAVFDTVTDAKQAQIVLSSKLYSFWVEMQKFSGFNPRKIILTLPKLDLSQQWDDNKIYSHFGITPDEIKFIEETIK